ncbi:hypothetical protein BDV06DRAFT_205686 [Aspergillus oleicola]
MHAKAMAAWQGRKAITMLIAARPAPADTCPFFLASYLQYAGRNFLNQLGLVFSPRLVSSIQLLECVKFPRRIESFIIDRNGRFGLMQNAP